MKKIFLLTTFALFIVGLIFFWWFGWRKSGHYLPDNINTAASSDPFGMSFGTTTPNASQSPSGVGGSTIDTSYIQRVEEASRQVTDHGDYEVAATDNYNIYYNSTDNYFVVSLLSTPLGWYRKQAQEKLLEVSQLSKEDLCKLNISVTVPYWVDENSVGIQYGLSFCPGSVVLPELDPNAH